MTADQSAQMADRLNALDNVMALWRNHRLTEEPSVEDLVLLAGWVATGDMTPIWETTDRDAVRYPREVLADADAMRWIPSAGGTPEGVKP